MPASWYIAIAGIVSGIVVGIVIPIVRAAAGG